VAAWLWRNGVAAMAKAWLAWLKAGVKAMKRKLMWWRNIGNGQRKLINGGLINRK